MNHKNLIVDDYIRNVEMWQPEMKQLRLLALSCGLTEELKWKQPCYSFQKSNIAIIGPLKIFCVLSFFKGALLKDTHQLLAKPGANTQLARIIPFTNIAEIVAQKSILKAYIYEAIEIEKAGRKVHLKKNQEPIIEELAQKFNEMPALKTAFEGLTPGRQRGYILHFSQPKQAKTRIAKIEKYIPKIINGKGWNDCTCGLSRKMPYCDGSHKYVASDKN